MAREGAPGLLAPLGAGAPLDHVRGRRGTSADPPAPCCASQRAKHGEGPRGSLNSSFQNHDKEDSVTIPRHFFGRRSSTGPRKRYRPGLEQGMTRSRTAHQLARFCVDKRPSWSVAKFKPESLFRNHIQAPFARTAKPSGERVGASGASRHCPQNPISLGPEESYPMRSGGNSFKFEPRHNCAV